MLTELIEFAKILEEEKIPQEISRLLVFKINKVDGKFSGEFKYLESEECINDYFDNRRELLDVVKNLDYYSNNISSNKAIGTTGGLRSGSLFIFKYRKSNKDWEKKLEEKIKKTYSPSVVKNFVSDDFLDLIDFLRSSEGLIKIKDILERDENKIKPDTYIFIDAPGIDYKEVYKKYLEHTIFLKREKDFIKKGICPICGKKDVEVGVPDTFNNANTKKPFIKHINTPFFFNVRICVECAIYLFRFKDNFMKRFKINPFPVFIDETLRKAEAKLFKETGEKLTFREIMRGLKQKNMFKGDLVNDFYLFIQLGSGKNSDDNIWIDYVPSYYMGNPSEGKDIFDIEDIINNNFFDNKLKYNYFNPRSKGLSQELGYRIHRYGEIIFNLVYRGDKVEFTDNVLFSLYLDTVKEKLRSGENFIRVENKLKEITDSYFYLEKYFFKGGKRVNIEDKSACLNISSDENFAYLAGQIVYYILSQSKSSGRTHSLIEPFINLKDWDIFKQRIIEIFEKYKHSISFDYREFNKCLSSVLQYSPKEREFSKLKVYFIAGYLDSNIFYNRREEAKNE